MGRRYEFYFRVAKQYFTNERTSSRRAMFFLLYRHADDGVFDDFPKISSHLPKISEDSPKLFRIPDERSQTFSENFRRCPKIAKTSEEDPKMFRWYTNEFKDVRAHCYCASLVRTLYMTWRVARHVFQARAPSRNSVKCRADDLCGNLICEYFCWMLGDPHFIFRQITSFSDSFHYT